MENHSPTTQPLQPLQPASVGESEYSNPSNRPPTHVEAGAEVEVWEQALTILKNKIPKAAFETWLRDTRPIAYEDGVLVVGARNAYARDWLENRISAQARNLLGGIVNDLRFVVEEFAIEEDENGDDEEPEVEIEVSAEEYASLYEQAVRPERAVYLPGYFRRWLKALGPDLAWFYVGFRQAAYWSSRGRRSGQYSGHFSGRQVAALCGVTERTFWNRVARDDTWQKLDGLIRKGGRRYTVAMSLPLTGPDARALTRWLAAHIEEYGSAESVLDAACQAPVEELLAESTRTVEAEESIPAVPLPQLLQEVFPDLSEKTIRAAAERLRLRLMPQNDQIVISLFFLENILPWLKAGSSWVYVLLRDKCFVDKDGNGRDTVTVHGGYQEIADWLGVSRSRTVYDWLRAPIARIYLSGSVERTGAGWHNPLTVRVLLNDVPTEIVQAASLQKRPVFDANFSVGLLKFDAIFSDSCRDFQSSLTQFSEFFDANFSPSLTQISEFFDAIFSTLKLLTLKTEPLNSVKTDQPARKNEKNAENAPIPSVGRANVLPDSDSDTNTHENTEDAVWDFEAILNRMGVNPTSRKRLQEEAAPPENFLAWFLEAMNMRGVDPLRVAVAWTLDPKKSAGAGEKFQLLARSPGNLRQALRSFAAGRRNVCDGLDLWTAASADRVSADYLEVFQTFKMVFGGEQRAAITLLRLLFGETVGFAELADR